MTVGRTQMLPSVGTGDRDVIVHQIQWCVAVQKPMNCHSELEKYPVWNVEPVKFVMQCLTQTAIELPSTGDNTRYSVQHTLWLVCYCPTCTSKNCVTVINPQIDKGIDECSQQVRVERPPDTPKLMKSVEAARSPAQVWETWWSRVISEEMSMPSKRTWLQTTAVSSPRWNTGYLPQSGAAVTWAAISCRIIS